MTDDQDMQSSRDKIRDYYDEVYYKDVNADRSVSSHLRQLADRFFDADRPDVLDVACGAGDWLRELHSRGARPAGIDISSKAIDICQAMMPQGEFYAGPAETLPFEDNRFHLVSCLGSLEHFLEPQKALAEMVRVAKDDAVFIILVPNAGFLTRRLGLYAGTNQVEAREEVLQLDEWQSLFESAGLKVEKRWKDLHVLSWSWISMAGWFYVPFRALQAAALAVWPLSWQYQVYHQCSKADIAR